jgi:2,3-bisphosphoglycerate-dependent phosphoglycerate mutase
VKLSMLRLLIARHGNTFQKDEVPRRVGARTDLPLVESGKMQAQQLGLYLKYRDLLPDAVYTSTLQRACQTAQIALAAAGLHTPIIQDSIFNEIDYGPDENMPEDKVIERIGETALEDWNKNAVVPQGWNVDPESLIANWQEFGERCVSHHLNSTVLVVTSNGIARFAPHLTGNFPEFARKFDIKLATGALAIFLFDGERWAVHEWNVRPPR